MADRPPCETTSARAVADKWFPQNATRARYASHVPGTVARRPAARIICFHGAGSDSTVFTGKGSFKRPLVNPLLTYCLDHHVELLAVHLPGRTLRSHEPRLTSMSAILTQVLDILNVHFFNTSPNNHTEPNDIPLVIAGHSLGALCAYELACAMRHQNLPLPKHLILSCMVSPDTPPTERPWTPASVLTSAELQDECRAWSINPAVFEPSLWSIYEPILRDDFAVLDTYSFLDAPRCGNKTFLSSASSSSSTVASLLHHGPPTAKPPNDPSVYRAPLHIPTTLFYASDDARVTESRVQQWQRVICGPSASFDPNATENCTGIFHVEQITGTHNFFYDQDARAAWMNKTTHILHGLNLTPQSDLP